MSFIAAPERMTTERDSGVTTCWRTVTLNRYVTLEMEADWLGEWRVVRGSLKDADVEFSFSAFPSREDETRMYAAIVKSLKTASLIVDELYEDHIPGDVLHVLEPQWRKLFESRLFFIARDSVLANT